MSGGVVTGGGVYFVVQVLLKNGLMKNICINLMRSFVCVDLKLVVMLDRKTSFSIRSLVRDILYASPL